MLKNKFLLVGMLFLVLFVLTSCGTTNTEENGEGKIVIYTTVYPLEDFSEKIGGKYVEVETIYPPGVDEHSYEPSQKDIINMAEGDLFFYIGYNLEGFMSKAEPILTEEGVQVVAVGEKVQLDEQVTETESEHASEEESDHESEEHDHGEVDPHMWLDPLYAKQLAAIVKDNLIEAMPEQEAYFEENYQKLQTELDDLNEQLTTVAENAKVKEFVVSHAAYGYWESRYGLTQLNISGISTSEEPSQKQLTEIIDEIEAHQLKYILVEQNVNNNLVDVIEEEANISTLPIHNLAVLTEDDIKNGEDYLSIMKKNIETLNKALNE